MKYLVILLFLNIITKYCAAQQASAVCWQGKSTYNVSNFNYQDVYLINNLLVTEDKFNYLQSQIGGKLKRYLKKDNAQRVQSHELYKALGNGQFAFYFETDLMILVDGVPLENRALLLDYIHNDFCTITYLGKKDVKKRFKMKVGKDMINIISLK